MEENFLYYGDNLEILATMEKGKTTLNIRRNNKKLVPDLKTVIHNG